MTYQWHPLSTAHLPQPCDNSHFGVAILAQDKSPQETWSETTQVINGHQTAITIPACPSLHWELSWQHAEGEICNTKIGMDATLPRGSAGKKKQLNVAWAWQQVRCASLIQAAMLTQQSAIWNRHVLTWRSSCTRGTPDPEMQPVMTLWSTAVSHERKCYRKHIELFQDKFPMTICPMLRWPYQGPQQHGRGKLAVLRWQCQDVPFHLWHSTISKIF